MQSYPFFVGIDVSKDSLDYWVRTASERSGLHLRSQNTPQAIAVTLSELARLVAGFEVSECLFCLEYTGLYQHHLLSCLINHQAAVWVEAARQIQHSLGLQRGKTDALDARRIARYAYEQQAKARLWQPPTPELARLKAFARTRQRLVETRAQLQVPLTEWQTCVGTLEKEATCSATLRGLEADIDALDAAIAHLIADHEHLHRLDQRLQSVVGIGPVLACELLLVTQGFTRFASPRALACFAGVVPFAKASGKKVKPARVSHLADKRLKRLLHLAALGAVR